MYGLASLESPIFFCGRPGSLGRCVLPMRRIYGVTWHSLGFRHFCVAGVGQCILPRSDGRKKIPLSSVLFYSRSRVGGFTIKQSQFPKHLVSFRYNSCLPHYLAMDSKHVNEGCENFHVRINGHNIPVRPIRFEKVSFWNFGIKPTYLNHLVRICRLMSKKKKILLTFSESGKLWRESKSVHSFCLGSLYIPFALGHCCVDHCFPLVPILGSP